MTADDISVHRSGLMNEVLVDFSFILINEEKRFTRSMFV